MEEGAEVADVAVVVDGGAAGSTCGGRAVGGESGSVFPLRVLKSSRLSTVRLCSVAAAVARADCS